MSRKSKWPASIAAGALAILAVAGVIVFGGMPSVSVDAQGTTTSTATVPFAFTVACVPNPATTQSTVTCTATQTMDTSGSANTYLWSFGDGTAAATGNPVTHTFATAGTYMVTATALTTTGNVQASTSVVVTTALGFTVAASPAAPAVGQSVTFTVTPASGTTLPADTSYKWDFGDGTTMVTTATPTVAHVFNTSGTYTVTVTATSALANTSGVATVKVTVGTGSQQLTLSFSPLTASAGQPQSFSVSATGNVPSDVVYTISWGDNTASSTGPTATHTYASPGTYTVTVTTTSAGTPGSNTTATFTVTVTASGPTQTYGPGWNMVGGPAGTVVSAANGPLYTFPAGATAYTAVPNTSPLQNGVGYWAYFNTTTTVTLSGTPPALPFTVTMPAGQYIMVGNPSPTQSVTVTGADVLYTYDPASGAYAAGTTLKPGQGGWVFSNSGGTLTMR